MASLNQNFPYTVVGFSDFLGGLRRIGKNGFNMFQNHSNFNVLISFHFKSLVSFFWKKIPKNLTPSSKHVRFIWTHCTNHNLCIWLSKVSCIFQNQLFENSLVAEWTFLFFYSLRVVYSISVFWILRVSSWEVFLHKHVSNRLTEKTLQWMQWILMIYQSVSKLKVSFKNDQLIVKQSFHLNW